MGRPERLRKLRASSRRSAAGGRACAFCCALIPASTEERGTREVDVDRIRPNPNQPRQHFERKALEDLAESIREHGLVQPLVVTVSGDDAFTLLVGERSVRYSADGENYVDVCPLCQETALDYGWIKEGSPTTPVVADRRRRSWFTSFLGEARKPAVEPVADEPILRRLSEPELAM